MTSGDRVVVEIATRGKLVVGEPFFDPGVPIVVDRKGLGGAGPGDLALVRTGRGRARVERVIGKADRIENVLQGLLFARGETGAHEPHAPPEPSTDGRTDLRDLPTFTIDPETAKDFDDAISIRAEGDGLRAYVHIADVSYFVPPGTPLDHGAAERGFSVYVPGLVAPMLPHELADDACSLRPHQDRLTVTVEIPFDAELRAGKPLFYRSVIRSRARLTYGQAQSILEGRERAEPEVEDGLRLAERLATELRRRRFARGALRIETREIAFAFDGEGGVAGASFESEPHAHMLVEEHMILANEAVGALLAGRKREALYRVHERPGPPVGRAAAVGARRPRGADTAGAGPRAADGRRCRGAGRRDLGAGLGVRAAVRPRRRGVPVARAAGPQAGPLRPEQPRPLRTGQRRLLPLHVTDPALPRPRRPPRAAARARGRRRPVARGPAEVAAHLSARERVAANVEHAAEDICLAWLLDATLFRGGWEKTFEGEIIGLIGSGLFARFGGVFEGFLPARLLGGDYFELNVLGTALEGRRTGRRYRLGDPIEVLVGSIDRADGKVSLRLA